MSFHRAYKFCQLIGYDFLQILTAGQQADMVTLLTNSAPLNVTSWFIGGADFELNGSWYWITSGKDMIYKNWNSTAETTGDCVKISTKYNYQWYEDECVTPSPFICKQKAPKIIVG